MWAVSVVQPVLLVGEVGVGKTSLVDAVGGCHFQFINVISLNLTSNGISLSKLNIFRGSSLTTERSNLYVLYMTLDQERTENGSLFQQNLVDLDHFFNILMLRRILGPTTSSPTLQVSMSLLKLPGIVTPHIPGCCQAKSWQNRTWADLAYRYCLLWCTMYCVVLKCTV